MKEFLIGLFFLALASSTEAQDSLNAARELYASASYEEALTLLTRLRDGLPADGIDQIDQYRSFCLLALGRRAEAERIVEGLLAKNPMLQVEGDLSPRLSTMFADIRRRLLPALARDHFSLARTALDKKDFGTAERELVLTKSIIQEAVGLGNVDSALVDLQQLVDGFLDLSRKPQLEEERQLATSRLADETTDRPETRGAGVPIFDISAADVVAPSPVLQEIPRVPPHLRTFVPAGPTTIVLDLVVDERGEVARATLRNSLHPNYDAILLRATRYWKYRPAVKDGAPVMYLRTIAIVVKH